MCIYTVRRIILCTHITYCRLQHLPTEGCLHYVSSVQTVHTVDSEHTILTTQGARCNISVNPGGHSTRETYILMTEVYRKSVTAW